MTENDLPETGAEPRAHRNVPRLVVSLVLDVIVACGLIGAIHGARGAWAKTVLGSISGSHYTASTWVIILSAIGLLSLLAPRKTRFVTVALALAVTVIGVVAHHTVTHKINGFSILGISGSHFAKVGPGVHWVIFGALIATVAAAIGFGWRYLMATAARER